MAAITPHSDNDAHHPKRMRIGTKSCAECRRRKVRCSFVLNSRVCRECISHDIPCIAQQSRHVETPGLEQGHGTHQRLQDLEIMVRRVCEAMNLKIDSSSFVDFEMSANEALRSLQLAGYAKEDSASTAGRKGRINGADSHSPISASSLGQSLEVAPLLCLFEDAMLIERDSGQAEDSQADLSSNSSVKNAVTALRALIPRLRDMDEILGATQKYWKVWHVFPRDLLIDFDTTDGITSARNYILDSLRSSKPAVIARAILCLALCMQQLPVGFEVRRPDLPASPPALLLSYLNGADILLSNESSAATIDGLESFVTQTKLFINMGRPQKAWLIFRRAMNFALILGLHRSDDSTDEQLRHLWSQIWQGDRQLSLILGLPVAISDSYLRSSPTHTQQLIQARFMDDLAMIAGHINERNQNHGSIGYSVTMQIDEELQQCWQRMPLDFWQVVPDSTMPLEAIYGLHTMKLYYYNLRKLLHLPYMLKSLVDTRYENSRLEALESSRQMIKVWQSLRKCSESSLYLCELREFQVFTAGIVLVIDLLCCSQTCPLGGLREAADWELVQSITRDLRNVSDISKCAVAGQAASLLDNLSRFHDDRFPSHDTYEAVVPYFGRVRIRNVGRAAVPVSDPQQQPSTYSNTLDFSSYTFSPNNGAFQLLPWDEISEAEMGIDWTTAVDSNAVYDWNYVFKGTSSD